MPKIEVPDLPTGTDKATWVRWGVLVLVTILSAFLSQFLTDRAVEKVREEVKQEVQSLKVTE